MRRERTEKAGLKTEFEYEEGCESVFRGDETKIKQIIYNLLVNAVKFTPEGGRIGIRAARKNDLMQIIVWDTGIGIPKEKYELVFEPFVQLDSSLSRKHEGVGLGLNLVKRLVELGGGTITIESKVGEGTKFIIEFAPAR